MIRVATLNLWMRNGDWPARRRVLRDGFAAPASDAKLDGPEQLVFAYHLPSWKPQLEPERRSTACGASDHFGLVADLEPI